MEAQPKTYDQARKEAFADHVANSGGRSEYMQPDFDAGFSAGYNAAMNNVALRKRDDALRERAAIAAMQGMRKDHSTFSNQAVAEKSVYTGTIIPMAKQFCEDLTLFLGLDMEGYYVDVNFNDVDCLQVGLKEAEEVKKLVNERCRQQFNDGLITYNDWRAQIHEAALDEDIYNKTKLQMTPDELEMIERIIKPNNSKPSTGESNERDIEKNPAHGTATCSNEFIAKRAVDLGNTLINQLNTQQS